MRHLHSGPATVAFPDSEIRLTADIWVSTLGPLHGWGGKLHGEDMGVMWDTMNARTPVSITFGSMRGKCLITKVGGTSSEVSADVLGSGAIEGFNTGQ